MNFREDINDRIQPDEGEKKEKEGKETMTISKDFILREQIFGGNELPKWMKNNKKSKKN